MSETLSVSFADRKEAIKLGAMFKRHDIFSEDKSEFIIPEDMSAEKASILKDKFGDSKKAEIEKTQANEKKWKELIKNGSTTRLAEGLKKLGLPPTEYLRVEMLRLFSNPPEGELKITWDALIKYSNDFNEKYGVESIKSIIIKYGLGGNYRLELETAGLSEEEKVLMMWAVPACS